MSVEPSAADEAGGAVGQPGHIVLDFDRLAPEVMRRRGEQFLAQLRRRRSVRHFSAEPVERALIDLAVAAAATAPSGAHQQPWTFVVVGDAATKAQIRVAAEREEQRNYEGGRMPTEWREALEPLGTTAQKSYLETVPWIVVAFEQIYGHHPDGSVRKHYYSKQSVGLACGMFITALHTMGLATLPHTPSPMGFLTELLGRPAHERPFILFPVGFPAEGCRVTDLLRKGLDEVLAEPPMPPGAH